MKISAISVAQPHYYSKKECKPLNKSNLSKPNSVAFNGTGGKIIGGLFGAGGAGIMTILALANPVGLVAAGTLLLAETGGAIIGGAIGDKITGKDSE